ncbi:MAG: hypothetical protein CM1200mP14_02430 [Gammaproteobacteria bacterium]|nr:MAG: hypothetical protein CM1200mP14_02430 [Gammaproteobacteria bacterium]
MPWLLPGSDRWDNSLSLTAQISLEATGSLSADTVGQGDVFELYVEIRVPLGARSIFQTQWLVRSAWRA